MELLRATTLKELKTHGSFNKIRQELKNSIGNNIRLKIRSWEDLLIVVQDLRDFTDKLQSTIVIQTTNLQKLDSASLYFQSDASRVIYALMKLDGEQRLRELGIDRSHTKDMEKARNWRNSIAKIIHPDVCQHPEASEASIKLTKIYEQMTGQ